MTEHQVLIDAYQVVEYGACNPPGIARTLVAAVDLACQHGSNGTRVDSPAAAAVRQILSQLCYLAGMSVGDYPKWDADRALLRQVTGPTP